MKFSIFEFGIFSFNSYFYYLTLGFIASTRAFNLPTCAFSVPTRAHNIATRAFSLLTRGFEVVTRRFELVTRVLLFHSNLIFSLLSFLSHQVRYKDIPSQLLVSKVLKATA